MRLHTPRRTHAATCVCSNARTPPTALCRGSLLVWWSTRPQRVSHPSSSHARRHTHVCVIFLLLCACPLQPHWFIPGHVLSCCVFTPPPTINTGIAQCVSVSPMMPPLLSTRPPCDLVCAHTVRVTRLDRAQFVRGQRACFHSPAPLCERRLHFLCCPCACVFLNA